MKKLIITFGLTCTLASTSFGVVGIVLETPNDDMKARWEFGRSVQYEGLKPLCEDYEAVQKRIWPLKPDQIEKVFGPKLNRPSRDGGFMHKLPDTAVLPLFAADGFWMSGLHTSNQKPAHDDLHAVGDVGFVQVFYNWGGEVVATAVFYLKVDSQFVPYKSQTDFKKRLEWDKARYERLKKWLDEKLPK